jgi:DNA-binding transcriptional LysR family regulator
MDARQLTYFCVTAKYEHMGKAATELGLSNSALSRSISRLEARCGTELFDRVGRGLRLNDYGRVLLNRVDRALSELDSAEREIQALVDARQPRITLGFLPSLGIRQVPELVMQFTRTHPNALFNLQPGSTGVLHDRLLGGAIDLFIGGRRQFHPAIEWQPLWKEQLVALVSPDHPLASQDQVELDDIAREPLVTFKGGQTLRRMVDDLGRAGGFTPNIVCESDEISTLIGLACAGFGVALVPESLARTTRKAVKLRFRSRPQRAIGVASLRGRFQTAIAQSFVDHLLHRARVRAGQSD